MHNIKMALVYDFDKTLSPKDMQEFHLLGRLGYQNPKDFWNACSTYSRSYNVDGILAYMLLLAKEDPNMTGEQLRKEGKYVKLYPGVKDWFKRMNAYGLEKGVEIEHYIISSGIKEIIEGTPIKDEFKKIYACSYYYDEYGHIKWPARLVNYTTKTQYLFRINKGVLDETNDLDLNRSTPEDNKYIPYERIVYFGDGLTDVPSMKVVRQFGGQTIAVFANLENDPAKGLLERNTASFVAKADYREGSRVDKIVKAMIDVVAASRSLDKLR